VEIAIAVVEFDDKFLVGERPEGAPLAGYWEFPGGKVEPGETPHETAIRECREETGIEVVVSGEYPLVVHEYDYGELRLRFFKASPREFALPVSSRFLWVPREQLGEYKFPEANEALLALLLERPKASQRDLKFWLGPAQLLTFLLFAGLILAYQQRARPALAWIIAILGFVLLGMSVVNKTILEYPQWGPRQIFFDLTAIFVTGVFAQAVGWYALIIWVPLLLLRRL
jgi:8-oxo-dGTP diphosphatase